MCSQSIILVPLTSLMEKGREEAQSKWHWVHAMILKVKFKRDTGTQTSNASNGRRQTQVPTIDKK